jgi:hypothetical protein
MHHNKNWQQYVFRITTVTTTCLTYHNTINNMSYISKTYCCQYDILLSELWCIWHIVVSLVARKTYCCLRCGTQDITTLSTKCLMHHNKNWQQYVFRITTVTTTCLTYHNTMWYVRHIVVSVVIRKTYCCQSYDA